MMMIMMIMMMSSQINHNIGVKSTKKIFFPAIIPKVVICISLYFLGSSGITIKGEILAYRRVRFRERVRKSVKEKVRERVMKSVKERVRERVRNRARFRVNENHS
jgi:hypothetical protein